MSNNTSTVIFTDKNPLTANDLNKLQTQITDNNGDISSINTKIGSVGETSLQNQISTINTKIGSVGSTSLQTQINGNDSDISIINTKIGNVGSTSLQTQINGNDSDISTINTKIGNVGSISLQAQITTLISGKQTITGEKTFTSTSTQFNNISLKNGSSNYGTKLSFGNDDKVYISEPSEDALTVKAEYVDLASNGIVVLPSTTTIGTVDGIEISQLKGVTNNVQSQINTINTSLNILFDKFTTGGSETGWTIFSDNATLEFRYNGNIVMTLTSNGILNLV